MKARFALALVILASFPAKGVEVLYARSNGELADKKQSVRYSSLYLLDGDPSTVWCSAGTGQGAEIEFVFDETVDIDGVEIWNGNQASPESFSAFSRVKKLRLALPDMTHEITVKDQRASQSFNLDPPLHGTRVMIRLTGGYRGPRRHACISDIIFYQGKKSIGGAHLKEGIQKSLPHFAFLDTWVAGPDFARNRELVFSLQGTFHYAYAPEDPTEPTVKAVGRWRTSEAGLELNWEKKAIPVEVQRDDAGRVLKLRIQSQEGLPAGMEQTYSRRQRFREE